MLIALGSVVMSWGARAKYSSLSLRSVLNIAPFPSGVC